LPIDRPIVRSALGIYGNLSGILRLGTPDSTAALAKPGRLALRINHSENP